MTDLKFPSKEAWQGNMKIFQPLLMDRTECPEPFAFAAALTAISMAIGRSVYVNYGRDIRLNLFTLLIGKANDSHKGLPITIVATLMEEYESLLREFDIADIEVIRTIDSGEGFINMIGDSSNTLVLMDEIASIFKKGSAKTSTIQTTLINAYDGTELGRGTVKTKRRIPDHFITMLAGSNPGLISDNLQTIDAESGLLGRYTVFYGARKTLVPWPDPIDKDSFSKAVTFLVNIKLGRHGMNNTEIKPTAEAKKYWDDAYRILQNEIANTGDNIQQELWKRLHLNIIKIAAILAVSEYRSEIFKSDIERAAAIGLYVANSFEQLRECIGKSRQRSVEDKIVAYLGKVGRAKKRNLQQNVRGKNIDARAFFYALHFLEESEIVAFDADTAEFYIPGSTLQPSTQKTA